MQIILLLILAQCCNFVMGAVELSGDGNWGDLKLQQTSKPKGPSGPSQPPPPPADMIAVNCKDDISTFCPKEAPGGNLNTVYCLETHKSELSEKCQTYLGSTALGGCNDDAQSLCGDKLTAPEIAQCLNDNANSLSQQCLTNIQNKQKNAIEEAQQRLRHVTRAITAISLIYLCIPLVVGFWVWRRVSELMAIHGKCLAEPVLPSSTAGAAVSVTKGNSCVVAFQELSYWVSTDRSLASLLPRGAALTQCHLLMEQLCKQPTRAPLATTVPGVQRKQILNSVSGIFRPGRVTAVMGPSGSGKTTLLKIMSGQMLTGELSGRRLINGMALSSTTYDAWIGKQGYVAQQDSLPDSLTVWQTLLFAAMLRLSEKSYSKEQKIIRARQVLCELGLEAIANSFIGPRGGGIGSHMMRYSKPVNQGQQPQDIIPAEPRPAIAEGGEGGGISGGQRRRLSIAIELLAQPPVIFLDEPTSGLDATSSLQIVNHLHRCSRGVQAGSHHSMDSSEHQLAPAGATVVLTVHQPRPEVFALFDDLILLGTGGHLVYSGTAKDKVPALFLSSCHSLRPIDMLAYDNVADYLMDMLAADHEASQQQHGCEYEQTLFSPMQQRLLLHGSVGSDNEIEMTERINNKQATAISGTDSSQQTLSSGSMLNQAFRQSPAYRELLEEIELSRRQAAIECIGATKLHARDLTAGHSAGNTSEYAGVVTSEIDPDVELGAGTALDVSLHSFCDDDRSMARSGSPDTPNKVPEISSRHRNNDPRAASTMPSIFGREEGSLEEIILDRIGPKPLTNSRHASQLSSNRRLNSIFTQLWITCWRRALVFTASKSELFWFVIQLLGVTVVVTETLSYTVDNDLEKPYQALMVLFLISTYAMIIQYLQLVPEYIQERQQLLREHNLQVSGPGSYSFAALLTEVPRSVVQCLLLLTVAYHLHPLNPTVVNKCFCYVGLMVGVCAWQSLICLLCALTDDSSVAYTLIFLVLGSGSLFGGLLIRLTKIPALFQFMYYFSVVAVTQRALIVNDMQCCYLTSTCNSLANSLHADPTLQHPVSLHTGQNNTYVMTTFCPPGLAFSGDGSDEGNLGRLYLKILGLDQDNPFIGLFILFVANIIFRLLAVWVLHTRQNFRYKMKQLL